jgi:hypothetical protein
MSKYQWDWGKTVDCQAGEERCPAGDKIDVMGNLWGKIILKPNHITSR